MEKPKDIDGLYSGQDDFKERNSDEAFENPSLINQVKGKVADLKRSLSSAPSEAARPSKAISRREFGKKALKAALAAPFIIQGIKERIFANENTPYYNSVSDELNRLSELYRIHDLPAVHVQQILRDMTDEANESARGRQKKALKRHLVTESRNYRVRRNPLTLAGNPYVQVRSESALHIEGNDGDFVTCRDTHNGIKITAYYYPDKNDKNLKGTITITHDSYKREYHGIVEEIENPGTLREEVGKLGELLLGENPAVAEAREMIESLDMKSDMVRIAETLSRISDLSVRDELTRSLLNKGELFLKDEFPRMQYGLYNSSEELLFGFTLPGDDPPKSASIYIQGVSSPRILTHPRSYSKNSLSLRDVARLLIA